MSAPESVGFDPPTVFLSYARVDALIVRAFADALEAAGLRAF